MKVYVPVHCMGMDWVEVCVGSTSGRLLFFSILAMHVRFLLVDLTGAY